MDFGINVFVICLALLFYKTILQICKNKLNLGKVKNGTKKEYWWWLFSFQTLPMAGYRAVFTVGYVKFSVIWYGVTLKKMFIIFSIAEMFWPLLYETSFICTSNFPWHCIINMVSVWFDWVVTVRRGTMGCWRCKDAARVGRLLAQGRRLSCKRGLAC